MSRVHEPADQPDTRLHVAHVLFMDIVGYSRLSMEQQPAILAELQQIVRNTREFQRAQGEQQIISLPTGDGMALVFFGSPETPLNCAIEISRALANRTDLPLRMGVHTGPVYRVADINANQNVAGGGINIAQRVMDAGDAGHILVSDASARMLTQLDAWRERLHDVGEATVKHGVRVHLHNLWMPGVGNPSRPPRLQPAGSGPPKRRVTRSALAAAIVATLGLLLWLRPWQRVEYAITSVVALPATVYGAPEYAFLSDAIPATLSTQLAKVAGLETKAPPSSAEFARINADVGRAGKAYGVSACVLTSVSAESDRLRLNVQLVEPTSRRVIWSDEYDGMRSKYLGIVRTAADGLRDAMRLRDSVSAMAASDRSSDMELAFRRGQHHSRRLLVSYSPADFDAARAALTSVVEGDPRAADAAAELAFLYISRIVWSEGNLTEADGLARQWAARAIAVEPRNALAWGSQAWADVFGVAPVNDKTIEAGVKSASFGPQCGMCQAALGSAMLASAGLSYPPNLEALRVDPLNIVAMNNAAATMMVLGRYDAAVAHYDQLLGIEPRALYAQLNKAIALVQLRRPAEASAILDAFPGADVKPSQRETGLLTAHHALARLRGESAAADAFLTEMRTRIARPAPTKTDLTWMQAEVLPWLALSGRTNEALDLLEETTAKLAPPPLDAMDLHPAFASLRGLPRFEAVRRQAAAALDRLLTLLEAARRSGELPRYMEAPLAQQIDQRRSAERR